MTDYDGDCVITRIRDEGTGEYKLRIDRADERIRIAPELLQQIAEAPDPGVTLAHGVLRIAGTNRTVTYRIGDLTHDGPGHPWRQAERLDEE